MEHLFIRILQMGISAGYLILAVLAVRFLLRKAPKTMRLFLWLLVGIRLLVPFSIESAFSLVPDTHMVNGHYRMETPQQIENTSPEVLQTVHNPLPASEIQPGQTETTADPTPPYLKIGTGIWLAGVAAMAVYMLVSWLGLANRVKTAVPVDIATDGEHRIKVYQSEQIDSPFLFGIIRPRIYIPENIADNDIPYVVLHEKTHRERKDFLIKFAGFLLLGVYWFHPLVWAAYIMMCRDIELICDEQVIRRLGEQEKKAYSQALLDSAAQRRIISACPVAFGEIGVRERVKNVLNYKKPAFWVVIAAAAVCVAVPVCFMTQQKADISKPDNSLAGVYYMEIPDETDALLSGIQEAKLTLDEKGEFTFSYDVLSSYLPYGSYELNGTTLTAVTSDGEYHYQFTLTDGGELVFHEAQSSKLTLTDARMGVAVRDGSVFAKKEDNPGDTIITEFPGTEETQNGSEPAKQNREEIEKWAQAFCSRNGKAIDGMLEEGAKQELTQKCNFVKFKDGSIELGWSSPWPWSSDMGEGYRIISLTDSFAEILYYAQVSDPHIIVWREQLTYKMKDNNCVITSEAIQFMEDICTLKEFEQAYPNQVIAGTMMDYYSFNGAGEYLHKEDDALVQPDKAAVCLLNLLDDQDKVSTQVIKSDMDENVCIVRITFHLSKGKSVDVTMFRPYGEDGVWVPYNASALVKTIDIKKIDDVLRQDAETLETLFPDHHEYVLNNPLTQSVDLDGDGRKENIKLTDLHYNGGDGGYALSVTDAGTGEQIPLPDGYTEENGFPLSADYAEPELVIGLGEGKNAGVIAKIKGGALLRIYERKGLRAEVKELMLKYNTFDSRIDAVSGCQVITREDESTPTLVLKSYVSGAMGHSDTFGYIITELKLQKNHTWNSKYYFLLDSCGEENS